jgi:hypothetical protein
MTTLRTSIVLLLTAIGSFLSVGAQSQFDRQLNALNKMIDS